MTQNVMLIEVDAHKLCVLCPRIIITTMTIIIIQILFIYNAVA